ncbi:hypothetical protein ACLOJK_032053, partial [Asimina triloba]
MEFATVGGRIELSILPAFFLLGLIGYSDRRRRTRRRRPWLPKTKTMEHHTLVLRRCTE